MSTLTNGFSQMVFLNVGQKIKCKDKNYIIYIDASFPVVKYCLRLYHDLNAVRLNAAASYNGSPLQPLSDVHGMIIFTMQCIICSFAEEPDLPCPGSICH